jgi:hypothetical protein
MTLVYHRLLNKDAWHCNKCLSAFADNLHFKIEEKERYFVELFSGSKTISECAEKEFNYRVFTIDVVEKYRPALCVDISKMPITAIPDRNKVFILWASVPCDLYNILTLQMRGADLWDKIVYSHRQYYFVPKHPESRKAIQLLEKTLWIIKNISPVYYFIENPRGALRHMPQMNFAPFRYTVSYNDFGADVYKPTDLFTNCSFLKFPQVRTSVGRVFPGSVGDMKNSFERSMVPPGLIRFILSQIDAAHSFPAVSPACKKRKACENRPS